MSTLRMYIKVVHEAARTRMQACSIYLSIICSLFLKILDFSHLRVFPINYRCQCISNRYPYSFLCGSHI